MMMMTTDTQPPTKASLKAWWANFTKSKPPNHPPPPSFNPLSNNHNGAVFGTPLTESLKYASVQISTANPNGELYVWGYIPVVVAKCGLFLKENATEIEGVFRVNGSAKRMRELQVQFEAPPKYGKQIDWKKETYTCHDVASVFRRYLTQMPEPVIPNDLYFKFRDTLKQHPNDPDQVITIYKQLIRSMPQPNQYLLLYVLDLLNVFAKKSDKNRMNAQNLAVIFRPGIISHPDHEMSPQEHGLSQRVLEFLIAQQDWLLLEVGAPIALVVVEDDDAVPAATSSTSALPSAMSTRKSVDTMNSWNMVSAAPSSTTNGEKKNNMSRWKSLRRRRSTSPPQQSSPLRTTTNITTSPPSSSSQDISEKQQQQLQRRKIVTVSLAESSSLLEERGEGGLLSPVSEDTVLSSAGVVVVEGSTKGGGGGGGVTRRRTLPSRYESSSSSSSSKKIKPEKGGTGTFTEKVVEEPMQEMDPGKSRTRREGSSGTITTTTTTTSSTIASSSTQSKGSVPKKVLHKNKRASMSSGTTRPQSP